MKRSVFIIFRPPQDYEESASNLAACDTREHAETIVSQVMDYMRGLARRLPQYPGVEVENPNDEFEAISERRGVMIDRARWPYGIDLRGDLPGGFDGADVPDGLLEIRELEIISPRKGTA